MSAATASAPPVGANEVAIRSYLETVYGGAEDGFLPIFRTPGERTDWMPIGDLAAVAAMIRQRCDAGFEVYHGMGLHPAALNPRKRGLAARVCALPGLYMDLDIADPAAHTEKKLPATFDDVLSLLADFPLPPSLLVHSGHGIYAHWLFREVQSIESEEERARVASALKRLQAELQRRARARGWKLDTTSDLARVLRPAGTINRKVEPVPVRTLHDGGERYLLEEIEDVLPDEEAPEQEWASDGEERPSLAPILRDCSFLQHCGNDAASLSEPEWHSMMTVVAPCADGERHAHELSKPYPRYSRDETQKKFERARAANMPVRCKTVESRHGGEWCARCAHHGQITSPIQLGRTRVHRTGRNGATAQADADRGQAGAGVVVPPFPLDVLPETVRRFVVSATTAIGCPPDFTAVPLLGLAEGVAGRSRRIVIRPGFEVSPGSWYGVVGEPGTGKSPGQKYALHAVTPLQDEAWEHYRFRLDQWEATPKEERGEKPQPEHFFITDSTGEALWAALASSPGVAQVEDELRRRLKALDAYRQAGDRQAMLGLWSNASVKIVRRTSAPVYIPSPVAPLIGGIQPGVLRHLRGEGDDAHADDGWVPRFLLSWPDAEPLELSDTPFDARTLPPVVGIFRQLRLARTDPHDTTLSAAAYAVFKSWHGDNRRAQMESRGLERQWAAKAPIHLARLALVLHLFAYPTEDRPLAAETMEAAIELLEYFRAHLAPVLPAFGASATAGTKTRITRILRTSKHRDAEGWVRRTDIGEGLRNVTPDDLTAALDEMLAAGIVERTTRPTTTKPVELWRLAPDDPKQSAAEDSGYSGYSGAGGAASGEATAAAGENPNNPNNRNGANPEVWRVVEHLQTFTPEEVAQFRREVAEAAADDPHAATDREALALFDAMRADQGAA